MECLARVTTWKEIIGQNTRLHHGYVFQTVREHEAYKLGITHALNSLAVRAEHIKQNADIKE